MLYLILTLLIVFSTDRLLSKQGEVFLWRAGLNKLGYQIITSPNDSIIYMYINNNYINRYFEVILGLSFILLYFIDKNSNHSTEKAGKGDAQSPKPDISENIKNITGTEISISEIEKVKIALWIIETVLMDFYMVVLNLCANSFMKAFRINMDFYYSTKH